MKRKIIIGTLAISAAMLFNACGGSSNSKSEPNSTTDSSEVVMKNNLRNSEDFEIFINHFLSTVYSEKSFDSLVYVYSPLIKDYTSKSMGFGRFWNMGTFCILYQSEGYGYNNCNSNKQPNTATLKLIKNKMPEGGFCEEATTPDGIYYLEVKDLPNEWDIEKGKPIKTPQKFDNLQKMKVVILFKKWIKKTMYFIKFESKWYLLYIDDCDCSA